MTLTQDASSTQEGQETDGDQPWNFARVRVSRGGEGMAPGAGLLVLQGVYEGSDEVTVAAAMTDQILEHVRRHRLHGRADEAQAEGARVHIRMTIEQMPELPEVPVAYAAGHDACKCCWSMMTSTFWT